MKEHFIRAALFITGGAIGFLVAKKLLETTYAELAQEEIDSVKEAFEEYINDPKNFDTTSKDKEEVKEKYEEISSMYRTQYSPEQKTNYEAYSKKSLTETEDIDTEAPYADEPHIDRSRPYVIGDEEFSNECDHHDKIAISYYSVDGILADERDEIMPEEDELQNLIPELVGLFEKSDIVYVRDEPRATDFEIAKIERSFLNEMYGVSAENLTPLERHKKRKAKKEELDEK